MLSTKFENLNMNGDEIIAGVSARIYYISNESFFLGEPIKYANLVSKVLRSLLERFKMKVMAIEEAHESEPALVPIEITKYVIR